MDCEQNCAYIFRICELISMNQSLVVGLENGIMYTMAIKTRAPLITMVSPAFTS